MIKVVLDTDVIVAAMRSSKGASAALLQEGRVGNIQLVVSTSLVLEYEAVCLRPQHLATCGLNQTEVRAFIGTIVKMADKVTPYFMWRPQLRDPNDEMVLETAINGKANAIITFNTRDYGNAPQQFGVATLTPKQLLERIRI